VSAASLSADMPVTTIMAENYYPGRKNLPDWNNLEILQINRLPPHAYLIPFPDQTSCLDALSDNQRYLSDFIHMLDGDWEVKLFESVLQLPENILSFRSGFASAAVPSIQKNLNADLPQAFLLDWPHVPQDQPVKVYRRCLHLPLAWSGQRKRLVLQGISAACHIYLNGRFVGYSEGSGLPAEFDVTHHLRDGDNDLFILVWSFCNGSYLEDESRLPLPGIVRDIYLEAVPPISLFDLRVQTVRDDEEDIWQLKLELHLISYRISLEQPLLRISVRRAEQKYLDTKWPVLLRPVDKDDATWPTPIQAEGSIVVETPLRGIEGWHCETPNVYDLVISIEDARGHELACYRQIIGFRQLEQGRDGFLISGRPLQLAAANWRETFFWQGKPDIAQMVRHLRWLKQHHFNALVIRDLPVDPIFLEICDIYGIYIISEIPANLPAVLKERLNEPAFWLLAEDRFRRQVLRDINHPCIIAWSAGLLDQAATLANHKTSQIRALDNNRFWQPADFADISKPLRSWQETMEPDELIPSWLSDPLSHGELGCCFGEWLSRDAIPDKINGFLPALLNSEGKPGILLRELKHSLSPLLIIPVDRANGAFTFKNRMKVLPASVFKISWVLLRDGHFQLSGELDSIRMPAGGEHFNEIWFGNLHFDDGCEYLLRFEVTLAAQWLWTGYGFEIDQTEFLLASAEAEAYAPRHGGSRLRLDHDRHHMIVSGPRFWLVFNSVYGALESWRFGDTEFLARGQHQHGLQAEIRASFNVLDQPWHKVWLQNGLINLERQVVTARQSCDGQTAQITFFEKLGQPGQVPLFELYTSYEIDSRGQIRIFINLGPCAASKLDIRSIPGIYLKLPLRTAYDRLKWQGKGPQPGLPGWQQTVHSGIYQQSIAALEPTEQPGLVYGGCHWLRCENDQGLGISVHADTPVSFSVRLWRGNLPAGAAAASELQVFPAESSQFDQPLKAVFELRPVVSAP
jgi:beta-galactosidase